MILASFYAPRLDHPRHKYDFMECLTVQRKTCQRFGVRQVVITDAASLGDLPTFHVDLPHELMPAILEGQRAFLDEVSAETILLVGADCLLAEDPRELPRIAGNYDLAVTTHPFHDCILNTGLIAVAPGAGPLVATFWRAALEAKPIRWGDDQTALAAAIGATLRHGTEIREGVRVRFLPVPGLNDAPENVDDDPHSLIVHFRGPRKTYMAEWARRHMGIA